MQKRIVTLVLAGIVLALASIWVVSIRDTREGIYHSLESRLAVARAVARNIDALLHENIVRLSDLSIRPHKLSGEEALRIAHRYSIFSDTLYLLDEEGNPLASYPPTDTVIDFAHALPELPEVLKSGIPFVSELRAFPGVDKKVVVVAVPLAGRKGIAVGTMRPSQHRFVETLKSFPAGNASSIYLVDGRAAVIASRGTDEAAVFKDHNRYIAKLVAEKKSEIGKCHRCHTEGGGVMQKESDVLAFAPLSIASWGIVATEPEEAVFGPSVKIHSVFLLIGALYVFFALLLAMGLSKSIVMPVKKMIGAARRIADGDLSVPIRVARGHEIGLLAESLEAMRRKLQAALESVRQYNVDLEKLVYERTRKLAERSEQRAALLAQALRAQEDERKRVARELHDDTSQSVLALGMALEAATNRLEEGTLTMEQMRELRKKTDDLLDGIGRLIRDLRPPVLDDLGFVSAVNWLLEHRLRPAGVRYRLDTAPGFAERCVAMQGTHTELRLFRIIQEAIVNIVRHAGARNVEVTLACAEGSIAVTVVDDGTGFDPDAIFASIERHKTSGYGLLGMRERTEHINGTMEVSSRPGHGTVIVITVPTDAKGGHEED